MTIVASSTSWCCSASITRSSCSTTRSSPPSAWPSSSTSSAWKCWRTSWAMRLPLPELARDVLLRAPVVRLGEDLLRLRVLDQLPVEQERRRVGDARGLLHVVGDDHDRDAVLELVDELLDLQRRDRVERRARLVHEDDVGFDRERPRDAEPLLLPAREPDAGRMEAGLDPPPQPRAAQRVLDRLVADLAGRQPQARRDVVEDRHRRERVGLLEDHADRAAHRHDVDAVGVDVLPVEAYLPRRTAADLLLVHAIDAPHHRRLARPGRPDQRRRPVGLERQRQLLDRVALAVPGVEPLDLDRSRARRLRVGRRRALRAPRRDGLLFRALRHRLAHASRFLLWTRRATSVRSRIMVTRASAAPQARATRRSWAWPTSWKIWAGSEFIRWPGSMVVPLTTAAVNSSGAVSPAARATASIVPVMIPGSAVGSTTRRTTCQRGAPRARAASRSDCGTSSSTTSAARATTGSISSDRASAPFHPANEPPTPVTTSEM